MLVNNLITVISQTHVIINHMKHFAQISSVQTHLLSAQIITIEIDVSFGTNFKFNIVGLPDKAVEESGDRVSSALKNSGFTAPKHSQNKLLFRWLQLIFVKKVQISIYQ